MSVHAAGPPDLEVEQAISIPAKGTELGSPQAFPMEEFLDRLMAAESGGHLHKKNPRSTALGPFQFIESTFLVVVNKHFPNEVAGLTERQILARRTEIVFSRQAARAYATDLISALKLNGLPATTRNVRIAFLVGPSAAVRLLKAPPHKPLKGVLSADAIAANPFMWGATVAKLVRKAAGDVSATAATRRPSPPLGEPAVTAAVLKDEAATATTLKGEGEGGTAVAFKSETTATAAALQAGPAVAIVASNREPADTPVGLEVNLLVTKTADQLFESKCQIGLASCRRWLALEEQRARLLGRAERWP
jgi:hypothetical protein